MSQVLKSTIPSVIRRGAGTRPAVTPEGMPEIEIKLDGRTDAGFSLIEYLVPAGFAPPPVLHRHTHESATGYIADGELTYWFEDGEPAVVGPGSVVHLPAGAWFRWANQTDRPARMIFVFRPAGFEQFFIEVMDAAVAAGGDLGAVIHPLREKFGDEQYPG